MCRAVAAYNAQNILRCGDVCYEDMQEFYDFIKSNKDRNQALWKVEKITSKPRRKKRNMDSDEDWGM